MSVSATWDVTEVDVDTPSRRQWTVNGKGSALLPAAVSAVTSIAVPKNCYIGAYKKIMQHNLHSPVKLNENPTVPDMEFSLCTVPNSPSSVSI